MMRAAKAGSAMTSVARARAASRTRRCMPGFPPELALRNLKMSGLERAWRLEGGPPRRSVLNGIYPVRGSCLSGMRQNLGSRAKKVRVAFADVERGASKSRRRRDRGDYAPVEP